MATKLCWVKRESNEGGLILRAFSARSPGASTVIFRYYLLEGDTAAPSGLYARLCHAFIVYLRSILVLLYCSKMY